MILPRLMSAVARHAPGVDLVVRPMGERPAHYLASGVHDLAIGPDAAFEPSLRSQTLFDDGFVCLLRRGHPLAKQRSRWSASCGSVMCW